MSIYPCTLFNSLGRYPYLKAALFVSLLFPCFVSAHPHAWVDTNTYLNADDTHITSIYMTWAFDADTSEYMLQGEDISPEHINETLQALATSVVGNMYNDHYFTYLYEGNTPIRYKDARYPQMVQGKGKNKNKLILSFEIPLSKPIEFKGKKFRLYIYDETYFVDMSWLSKSDMQLADSIKSKCTGELVEPKVSDTQRAYTLALAADVAPDNQLGRFFSQKYQLDCR